MGNIPVTGIVLELSIVNPGSGYSATNTEDLVTYNSGKNNAVRKNQGPQIDYFYDGSRGTINGLGPNKVDILHVDVTVGPSGEITSAEPNSNNRGLYYSVGDKIVVAKNGGDVPSSYGNEYAVLEVVEVVNQ